MVFGAKVRQGFGTQLGVSRLWCKRRNRRTWIQIARGGFSTPRRWGYEWGWVALIWLIHDSMTQRNRWICVPQLMSLLFRSCFFTNSEELMGLPIFEEILFDSSLKKRGTTWESVGTCGTYLKRWTPLVDLSLSGSSLVSGLKAKGASVKYLGTIRLTFW